MNSRNVMTLIAIQDEYVQTVNAGLARWAHSRAGGHTRKITRGARHRAEKQLRTLGYTDLQIAQILADAREMAELERNSE